MDRASVQSSVRLQFGLKADRRAGPAETGIAELMVSCFNGLGEALTHDMMFNWHRLVCAGRADLGMVGGYRTHKGAMQVVSGPLQKPIVHFEAPPSAQMQTEMSRFLDWFDTSKLPALSKAALAHLYFVTIYPFEDGNEDIKRKRYEPLSLVANDVKPECAGAGLLGRRIIVVIGSAYKSAHAQQLSGAGKCRCRDRAIVHRFPGERAGGRTGLPTIPLLGDANITCQAADPPRP